MILQGDALEQLQTLPDCSVQCCITSPPYWGLRDYGTPGQLGLEPTPEEYVAKVVDIFREVRRVLRDDGVLFLNLGDSYNGSQQTGGTNSISGHGGRQPHGGIMKSAPGLKPKDLVGIPWRVALALQQPYYTGDIKSVEDRIWLAAMIDAEGCIFIHKRKAGQSNGQGYKRKNDTYSSGLEVSNTCEAVVRRCQEITGLGSICHQDGHGRKQRLYRWNLRSNQCRGVLREIYPHMVAKQHEARLSIGCPSSGKDAESAHLSLMALHSGNEPSIDFPEPASMFSPGWYLRSDIIWKKPNPMPESVTDRPTKAHEYIFLLTKSSRYFWDREAVAEPADTAGQTRVTVDHGAGGYQASASGKVPSGNQVPGTVVTRAPLRNLRTVWTIATRPLKEAHFACFPPEIPEKCIKAGSRKGDTVLDPFGGAGTVAMVAESLGRSWVLCEINPEYVEMIKRRVSGPLFAEIHPTGSEQGHG